MYSVIKNTCRLLDCVWTSLRINFGWLLLRYLMYHQLKNNLYIIFLLRVACPIYNISNTSNLCQYLQLHWLHSHLLPLEIIFLFIYIIFIVLQSLIIPQIFNDPRIETVILRSTSQFDWFVSRRLQDANELIIYTSNCTIHNDTSNWTCFRITSVCHILLRLGGHSLKCTRSREL